ncbi:hypothetical protein ASC95_26525 [Pelomonas sp. Root1217]|uniref:prepilin-type N-terminal cleavage/methylation domain-containing protein n=1 Tax=Pelomonas sp. Root1217 TaxID=1736430 RepID=UPI000710D2B6|nr:prepilin-type N-terminal cleavage/methylation domain-containing protein [Pelomonas sp. Root1217]KQV47063.1 hypothetical protein ASC95_26525 [Pelomonas sp. Root1217]
MRRVAGFTLLELLVVLLLLGLAAGMVAPNASRWLDAAQERGWRADLKAYLETLPLRAFRSGEVLSIDAAQLRKAVPEPVGIQLRVDKPLRYGASGMAVGGAIELRQGASREIWRIRPISGEVDIGDVRGR